METISDIDRNAGRACRCACSLLVALLLALGAGSVSVPAAAQSGNLSNVLGGLSWGATPEETLRYQRERLMESYRIEVAGMSDPLRIDRVRERVNRRYEEIEESYEEFTDERTGYEVSVLAGELRPNSGDALITLRERELTRYYIYRSGGLTKIILAYDVGDLRGMGFEGFVERAQQVLGRPQSSEYREDENGVRTLQRVRWQDAVTRLRIENMGEMFQAYLLVYSDVDKADEPIDPARAAERRTSTRRLDAILGTIDSGTVDSEGQSQPEGDGSSARENIVDRIIGQDVDVDLGLAADEEAASDASQEEEGDEESSALDEDDELETLERRERRQTPRRSNQASDDDEEEEEEGITIY